MGRGVWWPRHGIHAYKVAGRDVGDLAAGHHSAMIFYCALVDWIPRVHCRQYQAGMVHWQEEVAESGRIEHGALHPAATIEK